MILDGFGWFWLVPCFSNYASTSAHNSRYYLEARGARHGKEEGK